MRRPQEVAIEQGNMNTIVNLTSAFEGLASMRIAQIKTQVLQAEEFFQALWGMYRQLRVDPIFRFGRTQGDAVINKELFIAITAEGGFSGDIDQKLIELMMKTYDPKKHDIIIVGHHGAVQLAQANIAFVKYFKLPSKEQNINIKPLVKEVHKYRNTSVFYQTYVSLMVQDVKRIELSKAVQDAGKRTGADYEDTISDDTYIFEPSTFEVVAHLENSMLDIMLSQLILDSKLAQYASRFRAMNVANDRATESYNELRLLFNRSRRSLGDERLKQTLNGRRKVVGS